MNAKRLSFVKHWFRQHGRGGGKGLRRKDCAHWQVLTPRRFLTRLTRIQEYQVIVDHQRRVLLYAFNMWKSRTDVSYVIGRKFKLTNFCFSPCLLSDSIQDISKRSSSRSGKMRCQMLWRQRRLGSGTDAILWVWMIDTPPVFHYRPSWQLVILETGYKHTRQRPHSRQSRKYYF